MPSLEICLQNKGGLLSKAPELTYYSYGERGETFCICIRDMQWFHLAIRAPLSHGQCFDLLVVALPCGLKSKICFSDGGDYYTAVQNPLQL